MPHLNHTNGCNKRGFWSLYLINWRSLGLLVLICALIALFTTAFNGLSYTINFLFSLGFGVPITMIETFLRTVKKPLSDLAINLWSIFLGSLFGVSFVYGYLVWAGIIPMGLINSLLLVNFGYGIGFSSIAFYFFWSRSQTQFLNLELKDQQLRAMQAENLQRQAENRLLQSQMEPHFLFNTLANIQSLIDVDAKVAKQMLTDLSYMLRSSLKNSSQDRCTLQQELDLVNAYIRIQQTRVGDRLRFAEQIDVDAKPLSIPPMVIQPLVENSIKHALEHSTQPVTLTVKATLDDEYLRIEVADEGIVSDVKNAGHGISLKNIRQRLDNLYDGQAQIEAGSTDCGWLNVVLLPIKKGA